MTRENAPFSADPRTKPDMDAILGGRRMRRNRRTEWSRRLVRESTLSTDDLIWPMFLIDGDHVRRPVAAMPGVERLSVDEAVKDAERAVGLGIPAIALFPYTDPARRDDTGSEALNPGNLVCTAIRAIKAAAPGLGIMADAALDPYTSHGHDGLLVGDEIVNDTTVEQLVVQSLIQAEAGADIIAPSDMMDGRVGAIRRALDANGFQQVQIMAYTAKYASAFYGPFRDAIGTSKTLKGDKRTYQMDPANGDEALREAELDIAEGADMIMVKPGMPYLDILWRLKEAFAMPTFAYQVSGEYAMIRGAADNGWIEGERAMMESLTAFKRAGAERRADLFRPVGGGTAGALTLTAVIPTLADIRSAADRIAGVVLRTPFLPAPRLSRLSGAEVWVKYENLQATSSFKERGALTKLLSLTADERARGVITMSAGNHAQAVAYHAERLGIPATIVMPKPTPFVKVAATRGFGADVILEGETLADSQVVAEAILAKRGATFIHPYDDPLIVSGQGTIGLEVVTDRPNLDAVLVPVGGGGLVSGIAIAVKALAPTVEVIGVETALYPSVCAALSGDPAVCGGETLAEGIAVKNVGKLTIEIIRRYVDDVVVVNEDCH